MHPTVIKHEVIPGVVVPHTKQPKDLHKQSVRKKEEHSSEYTIRYKVPFTTVEKYYTIGDPLYTTECKNYNKNG
jgi:hypothetical protein